MILTFLFVFDIPFPEQDWKRNKMVLTQLNNFIVNKRYLISAVIETLLTNLYS